MNAFISVLLLFNLFTGHKDPPVRECRKIEEKLYFNALLKKTDVTAHLIDSLKGCMNESPELHLSLGKYYYNRGDYTGGEEQFFKILKSGQNAKEFLAETYYYLSLCEFYKNKLESSLNYSRLALSNKFQPVSWVYNNMGLASSHNKNQVESIAYYMKALAADPAYDQAVNNIGVCYSSLHNEKKALIYYYRADSMVHGNSALYKSNIVRSLIETDQTEVADQVVLKGHEKFANSKYFVYAYGSYLNRKGKYDEAIVYARRLLKLYPENDNDWFSIARLYGNAGENDSSFYYYNISLKYDPNSSNAHHNIGLIYKSKGMFDKAQEQYDLALKLDSNSHYPYRSKCFAYLWQHQFDKAYEWAMKFYQKFPGESDRDVNVGYALLQLKRYDEAMVFMRKKLSVDPKDDRTLNNLGRCYAQLHQTDSAFKYLEAAQRSNPENSYIYHNLAALNYDLGRYTSACANLRTAMEKEYTWIIDDKLQKMEKEHCPGITESRKVLIYEYKGNAQQLSRFSFIQLSDSLLQESINNTIATENKEIKMDKEDKTTSSTFDSFRLFPNPTTGKFSIERPDDTDETLTIKVLNENGAAVLNESWTEKENKAMELRNVKPGMYVVMIMNNNSVLTAKKLILQ